MFIANKSSVCSLPILQNELKLMANLRPEVALGTFQAEHSCSNIRYTSSIIYKAAVPTTTRVTPCGGVSFGSVEITSFIR